MGRPKGDMTRLLKSTMRERIQEHLWKIYAYHKERNKFMNTWINSLNKHIPILHRFNIQKGGVGINFTEDQLREEFTNTLFEQLRDIEALNQWWSALSRSYSFLFSPGKYFCS